MNAKVLFAVLKRNFVSYFANPTGYVFICMFVALSTVAAFWPNEFFNTNLANLDQLNRMFPFIMLVFIPAISMAVWADERRQGTDELLLTIPAGDLEIVLGKYLAAVAIYTVSLLFSLVCNYFVLNSLASTGSGLALAPAVDLGLFLSTYAGYWLIGLTMLAVGMVASFLTDNLTVAYILGAAFNTPLVFAVFADTILPREAALAVKQWSFGERFADFGRGIVTFSGLAYFLMIIAVMLYLCMVLIGRRHWVRGRGGLEMAGHYTARTASLLVVAAGATVFFSNHDARLDVTSERLSSLSRETIRLLNDLDIERSVQIEAFISPTVPESYVQTRVDLLSMLRELKARGRGKVNVRINNTEQFSEEAARAEQRYDITPRRVFTMTRGTQSEEFIFMGVAFSSGLEKVILPFIDRGIPVEYELVRSIATVTDQERKKIGILRTDAQLFGGFDFQMGSSRSDWQIVEELRKQYEVEEVDPSSPISERYDALLAVQPSSLGPEEMDNFLEAVQSGQPTAIFEDPFPIFAAGVPATSAPRRPPGGMNSWMGGQPPEKGDIRGLWADLGIDFSDDQIVWQDYNPYPVFSHLPVEFVFIEAGEAKGAEPFNESAVISSKLQHVLFPFPGSLTKLHASNMQFTPLVRTGDTTGTVRFWEVMQPSFFGQMSLNPNRRQIPTKVPYVLAAQIQGKLRDALSKNEDEDHNGGSEGESSDKTAQQAVNVVLVADIDMLHDQFFRLREMGDDPEGRVHLDFDNVTFVLNALDVLARDERFLDIRKRRPLHRTLAKIEERTAQARKETADTIENLRAELDKAREEEENRLQDRIAKLQKDMEEKNVNVTEIVNRVGLAQRDGQRRMEAKLERLEQQRDKKINQIETDLNLQVRGVQDRYKMWAVLLPPIPPLLVALAVWIIRRRREREGVARTRLRS